jgi:pimeloyl-ACP methyl ester carboxylesterase
VTKSDIDGVAGIGPDEFGSGLYDAAARLDERLADVDWLALPPGSERIWFDAPSGRLAGVAQGNLHGPRVLLLPGVTGSKEDFSLMLPLLAAAGYRVESFDLAGQFESASAGPELRHPPTRAYDYDLFVDDVLAIVSAGTTPVHLLGYSFAATVAQLAVARRPELFASLALLSAPPQPGQGLRGIKRIGRFSSLASGRVGAALMIWGVSNNLNRAPASRKALVRERFRFTRRQSVVDVIGLMMSAPDVRDDLARLALPTLVAVGEHDLWPLSLHSAFAREIGASIAVYRTGHSPCETSPHQVVRDLLALYERTSFRA